MQYFHGYGRFQLRLDGLDVAEGSRLLMNGDVQIRRITLVLFFHDGVETVYRFIQMPEGLNA